MRVKKVGIALAGMGLALALGACGDSTPVPNGSSSGGSGGGSIGTAGKSVGTAKVMIKATDANQFDPKTQSAAVGDVVEWENSGTAGHNITFDDSTVNDTAFGGGAKWQIKFTKAGSYKYQCTIHPGMTAEIDVK